MAAAYSMDLRERVIRDADAGIPSKVLAERYHVSLAWVDALKQRRRETGSLRRARRRSFGGGRWPARRSPGRAGPGPDGRDACGIARGAADPRRQSRRIWRAINQLELTVKKTVYADEQRRPDVAARRRAVARKVSAAGRQSLHVFRRMRRDDRLLRRYGRSLAGAARITPHAGTGRRTRGSPAYGPRASPPRRLRRPRSMRRAFSPTWSRSSCHLAGRRVVVLDNLAVHKQPEVGATLEGAGRTLRFFRPTVLDFNPIEQAFAKLKALLRAVGRAPLMRSNQLVAGALRRFARQCAQTTSATAGIASLRIMKNALGQL